MKLPQVAWDPLPYERFAARFVGGTFAIMFCAGLLLRTPWFPQLMTWLVLVPGSIWLAWTAGRPHASGLRRTACFWSIVMGLACYLAVLLLSTAAAGVPGKNGLAKHLWDATLCLLAVVALAYAVRKDLGFARYLGRWLSIAVTISALVLIAVALANGALGQGRLGGVSNFNWVLNPNAVGGVYAVCFAISVGHALRRDISQRERVTTFMFALLPLAIVLLTQSRGAMLGCLAAIAVALVALPRRLSVVFCIAIAATAALIAITNPESVQRLFSRGDSSKLALWLHFLALSRDQMWLGRGLDFDATFKIGNETIYTPHNILIAAMVRGGILGLLSLAAALAGAALAAVSAARRGWWLPLAVLASALALNTVDHEMVPTAFNFYWYLFWLPLGLATAAALIPPWPDPASVELSAMDKIPS